MKSEKSRVSTGFDMEKMEDEYPVEQFAVKNEKKITDKEVKEAVRKINPDMDSLGSRG